MNATTTVLLAYVELGLIVAVGYLLLHVARRSLQSRVAPAGMIRTARALFAVMLLCPLAAHGLLAIPAPAGETAGAASVTLGELTERLRGLTLLGSGIPGRADAGTEFALPAWSGLATGTIALLLVVGIAIAAFRVGRRIRALHAVVLEAVPYRRIGRVSILVSDDASVPFSTAIFGRAHVVLPHELLADPELLRLSVRHELQHYRERDPLWSVALELFRVVLFWNPAAHGWARQLSDLQELACDEAIVRRGVTAEKYGNCLLRVAEMAVTRRIVASSAMATVSDRGAHLRRRIDMLFQDRALANSRRWAVAITTLLSFVLIVSATVTAATWPSADSGAGPAAIPAPATAADPCDAADCEEPSQPEIAAELPNLVFRTADGAEVSLEELRGSVVVVEFWASWCRYCEADVPVMKSLHGLMSDTRDFQLAGASISESAEAMWAYVDEHGIEWPQAQLEGGWKDDVTRAFGVRGVPSRYLIDRDGRATLLPRTDAEGMARLILKAIDGEPVVASTAR